MKRGKSQTVIAVLLAVMLVGCAELPNISEQQGDMIAEYEKQRAAAFAVVIGMDNRAYMRVLYLRYFSRLTWNEIAEAMGFKRDTKRAHQIHREAMAELDRVMGGEA